ncbi:hypothetical protein R950_002657 [Salmonella enterica subsp. enterica]|nr:hypothetical protein [Salmonella enterica subsp. enterica serovar Langford]
MEKFIKTPFASMGDRNDIPDAIQSTGDVSMLTGYGYDYERDQTSDANAKNIERQKMNWLFYVITQALNEYQSLGVPDFITSELNGGVEYSYKKSAIVRYGGIIYISLVDDNTALPTDDTKWSALVLNNSDIFDGYLKIDNLLSEIKDKGTTSQQQTRKNIGIDGDIAYRNKQNTFAEINTFTDEVTTEAALHIGRQGGEQGRLHFWESSTWVTPYVDSSNPMTVGLEIRQVLERGKSKWRLQCTDARSLALVIGGVETYPTLSVNNVKPDANGNVKVSTGTTYSNSASKSANGWFRDSSTGVIRQWGIGALNTTINFPMAFPTACTSIQVAILNSDPDDAMSVHDRTSTSFKPYNYWGNSGMSVIWGADGY